MGLFGTAFETSEAGRAEFDVTFIVRSHDRTMERTFWYEASRIEVMDLIRIYPCLGEGLGQIQLNGWHNAVLSK